MPASCRHRFAVADYDLAATLDCGQAFRWRRQGEDWSSIVNGTWVVLRAIPDGIEAQTVVTQTGWDWLGDYLQTEVQLRAVLRRFPEDGYLQSAVAAHHGLRLLRQPAWECLASFILSSTKQIVQIRQIIERLCERFGGRVPAPEECGPQFAFPGANRLAQASERELRACKMGFRAEYLRLTAQAVASGAVRLEQLGELFVYEARQQLMMLPGVGEKIADCVLLFAYGFEDAFPIDVWVARALRQNYFQGRTVPITRLREFAAARWRGCGGYAQQYLFHHARMSARKTVPAAAAQP